MNEKRHETTITDETARRGYGPLGHGVWSVVCSCGWYARVDGGGRNRAEIVASDHRSGR